jgi:hypothetical protein
VAQETLARFEDVLARSASETEREGLAAVVDEVKAVLRAAMQDEADVLPADS